MWKQSVVQAAHLIDYISRRWGVIVLGTSISYRFQSISRCLVKPKCQYARLYEVACTAPINCGEIGGS